MTKVAVVIPCWRRSNYLRRCLSSIRGQGADVLLYPDHDDDGNLGVLGSLADEFGAQMMPTAEQRMYCDGNTIRAFEHASKLGYEFIVQMDSDVVVSPNYISLMLSAFDWCGGDHLVGSSVLFTGNERLGEHLSGAIKHVYDNGSNLVSHRSMWPRLLETLSFVRDKWLGFQLLEQKDNASIRKWFSSEISRLPKHKEYMWDEVFCESGGTANDAITQMAAARAGYRVAFLAVNRAVTIGEHGENQTSEGFAHLRSAKLWSFDSDSNRRLFFWRD